MYPVGTVRNLRFSRNAGNVGARIGGNGVCGSCVYIIESYSAKFRRLFFSLRKFSGVVPREGDVRHPR